MVVFNERSRHGGHRRRRSGDGQVLGLLLVVGGAAWLLQRSGAVHVPAEAMLSCLLIALGAGMVLTSRRAGGAPLVLLGVALTMGLIATSSSIDGHAFRPRVRVFDTGRPYQVAMGDLPLDLTTGPQAAVTTGTIPVHGRVGIGQIHVLVPADASITAHLHSGVGELTFLGRSLANGTDVRRAPKDMVPGAARTFDLDLEVGVGSIVVERAQPPAEVPRG